MLTPTVPTREVYFVRFCKQLNAEQWAIVDVSIDEVEENIDASLVKCRKRPSGCIIEDKSNGHCKVSYSPLINLNFNISQYISNFSYKGRNHILTRFEFFIIERGDPRIIIRVFNPSH